MLVFQKKRIVFWCIVKGIMGFERFEDIPPELKLLQKEPEEVDLSRRNFLKGIGVVALGSVVGKAKESFAESNVETPTKGDSVLSGGQENLSERLLGLEYKNGVELFRQKALSEKEEYAGFYMEKNGKGVWQMAQYGEGLAKIDYDLVETGLKEEPNLLYVFHTHPTEGIYTNDEKRKKDVREGKEFPVGMPPSLLDIGSSVDMHDQLLGKYKGATEIKEKVIDEAGVWTYSFDDNHPYIKEVRELKKETKEVLLGLSENPSVKVYLEENPGIEDSDPRIVNINIFSNMNRFDQRAREGLAFLIKKIEKLSKDGFEVQMSEFMYRTLVKERRQPSPQQIAELYKKIGVNLVFEPHEIDK